MSLFSLAFWEEISLYASQTIIPDEIQLRKYVNQYTSSSEENPTGKTKQLLNLKMSFSPRLCNLGTLHRLVTSPSLQSEYCEVASLFSPGKHLQGVKATLGARTPRAVHRPACSSPCEVLHTCFSSSPVSARAPQWPWFAVCQRVTIITYPWDSLGKFVFEIWVRIDKLLFMKQFICFTGWFQRWIRACLVSRKGRGLLALNESSTDSSTVFTPISAGLFRYKCSTRLLRFVLYIFIGLSFFSPPAAVNTNNCTAVIAQQKQRWVDYAAHNYCGKQSVY